MRALSMAAFKKRFGLTQKDVNDLVRWGEIKLEQNGYKGHVTQHHKIIVFPAGFARGPRRPKFDGSRYGHWYRSQLRLRKRAEINSFIEKHGYSPLKEELEEERKHPKGQATIA